jgi:ABC transporter substrate binding protein
LAIIGLRRLYSVSYSPALCLVTSDSGPSGTKQNFLDSHALRRSHLQGLRDGLKKAGYIEGENLVLNMMQGKNPDELRSIAKEHAKEKIDIIVTTGNAEMVIAKAAWVIPLIFMSAAKRVQSGSVIFLRLPPRRRDYIGASARCRMPVLADFFQIVFHYVYSLVLSNTPTVFGSR